MSLKSKNGKTTMNFDEFDRKMRFYERSIDQIIIPGNIMVARLDGRDFTRLTREVCHFEAPFDIKFRDLMVETLKHLMTCGFRVIFGYTESDEISLLFHKSEDTFGRKVRKYNSVLAGEASASFSIQAGILACFDCRMIPLPNEELLADYFLWRQEDACRNALNAHCYWMLRKEGSTAEDAAKKLLHATTADKNEILFSRGINFNDIPLWQKRGAGVFWKKYEKEGFDPVTQTKTSTDRFSLYADYDLPCKKEYSDYIMEIFSVNE